MNTQDNQGNGLIGGGIGLGLGIGAAVAGYPYIRHDFQDVLSKRNMYNERIQSLYQQKRSQGYAARDEANYGKPYNKAVNKIYEMGNEANAKARPYAQAASLLYALGVPITAALIGSTLTD